MEDEVDTLFKESPFIYLLICYHYIFYSILPFLKKYLVKVALENQLFIGIAGFKKEILEVKVVIFLLNLLLMIMKWNVDCSKKRIEKRYRRKCRRG